VSVALVSPGAALMTPEPPPVPDHSELSILLRAALQRQEAAARKNDWMQAMIAADDAANLADRLMHWFGDAHSTQRGL